MADKVIEARVIQKVATEVEWLQTTLPLYQGEIAFVSDKNNFKLNTQPQAKTFAELEYYYKGDILAGVLPTDDLASKPDGVYRATISGTYSGVVVKDGYYTLLRKKDGVWSLESEVKMPSVDVDGDIAIGQTTKAVNGDTIYKFLYKDVDSNILYFTDKKGKVYGLVNNKGEFEINLTDESKRKIYNNAEWLNLESALLVIDINDRVIFDSDKTTLPKLKEDRTLTISEIKTINNKINFTLTALGRATTLTSNDAPKVVLNSNGCTHPKVIYFKNKLFGYHYWMALTPTFGPIADQSGPAYFENPHVMCSNDGINWTEPTLAPLDVTAPNSYTEAGYPFWSDTHLVYENDGYLYCYYRGVNMPKRYIHNDNTKTGLYSIVTVRRRTNDGVNWSDREIVSTTEDIGANNGIGLISPALDFVGNTLNYFEIISTSANEPIAPQKNQEINFIHRRSFTNGKLDSVSKNKIINLVNRPWGVTKNPWHIDYIYVEGVHFLLINIGLVNSSMGNDLYLAYSYDGWNFTSFSVPINEGNTYRSSLSVKEITDKNIFLEVYQASTIDGSISIKKITLNK